MQDNDSPRKAEGDTVPLLRETMTLIPVSTKGTENSTTSDLSSLMVREPMAMSALLDTTWKTRLLTLERSSLTRRAQNSFNTKIKRVFLPKMTKFKYYILIWSDEFISLLLLCPFYLIIEKHHDICDLYTLVQSVACAAHRSGEHGESLWK